jgi:hypothetical protein
MVNGGHDGKDSLVGSKPNSRTVLDLTRGEPAEAALNCIERISGREQLPDLGLRQVERHKPRGYFFFAFWI